MNSSPLSHNSSLISNHDEAEDQEWLINPDLSWEISDLEINDLENSKNLGNSNNSPITGYFLYSLWILFYCLSIILWNQVFVMNENIQGQDYIFFSGIVWMLSGFTVTFINKINVFNIQSEIAIPVIFSISMGLIGMPLFYIAMKYIPTSQWAIIQSLHPLLGTILAYFVLKEDFPKNNILYIITAFIGVVLINLNSEQTQQEKENSTYGIILCVISLLFISTQIVSTNQITNYVDPVYSPFYFALGMFLTSLYLLLTNSLNFSEYSMIDTFMLTLSWVLSYISQSCLSYATNFTSATSLQPMSFSTPFALLAADLLIFNEEFSINYFIGFWIVAASISAAVLGNLNK